MFRDISTSKDQPDGKPAMKWEAMLRPHLFHTELGPGDFDDDLVDTIESLDRDIVMYGLGETKRIPGVGETCYEMRFDSNMHGGDDPRPMTYYVGTTNEETTATAITLPDSGRIEKQLKPLQETDEGFNDVSDSLVERIRAFDSTMVNTKSAGSHDTQKLYKCLEPEEVDELQENRKVFIAISQDAYNANQYFTQMASLVSTGYFADNESMKFAAGIHGLRSDGEHSIFSDQQRSGRDKSIREESRQGLQDCQD